MKTFIVLNAKEVIPVPTHLYQQPVGYRIYWEFKGYTVTKREKYLSTKTGNQIEFVFAE